MIYHSAKNHLPRSSFIYNQNKKINVIWSLLVKLSFHKLKLKFDYFRIQIFSQYQKIKIKANNNNIIKKIVLLEKTKDKINSVNLIFDNQKYEKTRSI